MFNVKQPVPPEPRAASATGYAQGIRMGVGVLIGRTAKSAVYWGPKATFSLAEQAIFSGSSFVLHIMLARWLLPAEYGGFAVALSVFFILAGIQNALILEPISVFGAKKSASELQTYLASLFWPHNGVTVGIILLAFLSAPLLTILSVGNVKWALPISTPLILSYWAARRVCYLKQDPKLAFILTLTYATLLFLGLITLRLAGWVSSFSAFLLLGIAGIISTCIMLFITRRSRPVSAPRSMDRSLLLRHWKYGKWVLGETVMCSLTGPMYPLLIAFFAGLEQAGAFRAILNLVLPLSQVLAALALLLLPWMAKVYVKSGSRALASKTVMLVGIFLALAIGYILPTVGAGSLILTFFYGDSEYQASLWLLPYFGIVAVLSAVAVPLAIALRVAERPDQTFWAKTASASITITVGIYLATVMGMKGLVLALVVSTFMGTLLLGWFSRILWKSTTDEVADRADFNLSKRQAASGQNSFGNNVQSERIGIK